MSSRAFPANGPGNPGSPFQPFPAGEIVFYLVALLTRGSDPEPAHQLVSTKTERKAPTCDGRYTTRSGAARTCAKAPNHPGRCGFTSREILDTMTETAYRMGPNGRRQGQAIATRSVTWSRFTRGAKAQAREALDSAPWTTPDGRVLRIWCKVVLVSCAEALGFQTPTNMTAPRPDGYRNQGREHNAQATIRGSQAVPVVERPAPAPEPAQAAVPEVCGRTGFYGLTRGLPCYLPRRHAGSCRYEIPTAQPVGLDSALSAIGGSAPAPSPAPAPSVALVPQDPSEDPSVIRFRLLDLDDTPAPTPEPEPDPDAPARIPLID